MNSIKKKESTPRRTSAEIIDLIYAALPVESKINITQLSKTTGLDWGTTKRGLDLILHVFGKQKGMWLIEEQVQASRQPIYGRKRR